MNFRSGYLKIPFCFVVFSHLFQAMEIPREAVLVPQRLGEVFLCHDLNGFSIKKEDRFTYVQPCFMDKELRGITKDQLSRLIGAGLYISVNNLDKNNYSLKLNGRLKGGGIFGTIAGAFVGKAIVSIVGHGTILLISSAVSVVATPAIGTAVGMGLESTFGPAIEAASLKGAIAGGILVGTATGPV